MKTDCCQNAMGGCENHSQPPSPWRRAGGAAGWIVPGITLVFIPKCPLCLAAYVAMATGIGVSLPVAAFLRITLLIVCVSALALVVGAKARRSWLRRNQGRGIPRYGGQDERRNAIGGAVRSGEIIRQ